MTSEFDDEYVRLTIWLHHAAEQAEAHVERANRLIRKLTDSGLLAEGVILGAVIYERRYIPGQGRSDSAQLVQAVLHLPKGLGVVLWDSEEYVQLEPQQHVLEEEVMSKFSPFAECELAIKALYLPHLPELMDKLRKRLT